MLWRCWWEIGKHTLLIRRPVNRVRANAGGFGHQDVHPSCLRVTALRRRLLIFRDSLYPPVLRAFSGAFLG